MKKVLIYPIILLLISGCSIFKKPHDTTPLTVDFVELNYGICDQDLLKYKKQKNTPTGTRGVVSGFNLIEQTDTIPGEKGLTFGVEYLLKSKMRGHITIEQVWVFPTIVTNEKGEKYKEIRYPFSKPTNKKTATTFTFVEDYEIVKGEWKYQLFFKGDLLYERKFYVE
jgi:hypothetical protein